MRVGSVCSGVGGFDLGFHRGGAQTIWLCEADAYRRRVLARHWPGVPIHEDLTTLDPAELEAIDCLIGGTPCQDLSVAGRQAGLEGSESRLFWDFARIRNALGPKWTVWENVPGALSSNGGVDFALVLGAFVGASVPVPADGWGGAGVATGPWGSAAWRILDSRYFGVAQRRRRVFVVGHLGGGDAPEVLFEPAGSTGDSPPSREAGTEAARGVGARASHALGRGGRLDGESETFVSGDVAVPLTKGSAAGAGVSVPGRRQEDDLNLVGTLQGGAGKRGHRIGADEAAGGGLDRGTVGALDTMRGGVDDNDARAGHLIGFHTTQDPISEGGGVPAMSAKDRMAVSISEAPPRAFMPHRTLQKDGSVQEGFAERPVVDALHKPTGNKEPLLASASVRRLTPTERERLQALPDGWTVPEGPSLLDAPLGGIPGTCPIDPLPHGPREAATGDAVTASVAEWIAGRLP